MKMNTQVLLLLALAAGGLSQAIAQPNPVSWWQCENNLNDSAGTNHGIINDGLSFTSGHSGQGFDIHGGYVSVPDNPSLRPSSLTVQLWVKEPVWPNTYRYLVSMTGGASSYAIYTAGQGNCMFFINGTNASGSVVWVHPAEILAASIWDGNWHQVTGTWDNATKTASVYLDGVLFDSVVNTSIVNINYSPTALGQLMIGNYPGLMLNFVGVEDDVKIYNRALSATEVADTYADANSHTDALVSWYQAEGNTLDSWGSNHGAIVNHISGKYFDYVPGKSGTGLLTRGWMGKVPDSASLCPTNVSVQAWVKATAPSTWKHIVGKLRGDVGGSYNPSYDLGTGGGGGQFYVDLYDGVSPRQTLYAPLIDTRLIWDGAWHLFTGTYDGSVARAYLDGLEFGSGRTNDGVVVNIDYSFPHELTIGDCSLYGGWAFNGYSDEFKVFDRALAPAEIAAEFASFGGLVSWWQATTNANDSIGANHGTLLGSAGYGISRSSYGNAFITQGGAVSIPDDASLRPARLTLQAEVAGNDPITNRYIISKSDSATAGSYGFYTGPNGGLQFFVSLDGAAQITSPDAGPAVWNRNFHLVDGTFDGTTVRLFVDGVEVGSGTSAAGSIHYGAAQDSGALLFGNFSSVLPAGSNFPGSIDEVKLYTNALSQPQIAQNVFSPVMILVSPQGTNVVQGQAFTLSAVAQGISPVYQWRLYGTNLVGATASSLTITNVQPSQAGAYSVQVSGGGVYYVADTLTNNFNNNKITGYGFKGNSGAEVFVANSPALESQDFTVQCWARNSNPGPWRWIMSKARHPSYYSASWGLLSYGDSGATFIVAVGTDTLNSGYANAGTNYWDGKWHQFTGIWRAQQVVELYVDGEFKASMDAGAPVQINYQQSYLNGDLVIGDVVAPPGSFNWNGDLDEVKFFDHALLPDDVMQSYTNANSFAATNGLLYWYRFENNLSNSISGISASSFPTRGSVASSAATVTVLPPPSLVNAAASGGNFSATVTGPTGKDFVIWRSSNLSTWMPIYTNTVPFSFTDPLSGGNTQFYRARGK